MPNAAQADEMLKWISLIHRKTQMFLSQQLEPMGITSGQVAFLMHLAENGRTPQNRLGELFDLDKSTVAKVLARLESQGYVTRRVNTADARSFDISPTEKTVELLPLLREIGNRWALEVSGGMTEIERWVFFELLGRAACNAAAHFGPQDAAAG